MMATYGIVQRSTAEMSISHDSNIICFILRQRSECPILWQYIMTTHRISHNGDIWYYPLWRQKESAMMATYGIIHNGNEWY